MAKSTKLQRSQRAHLRFRKLWSFSKSKSARLKRVYHSECINTQGKLGRVLTHKERASLMKTVRSSVR